MLEPSAQGDAHRKHCAGKRATQSPSASLSRLHRGTQAAVVLVTVSFVSSHHQMFIVNRAAVYYKNHFILMGFISCISLLLFLKVHIFRLHIPRNYNGRIVAVLRMDSAVELVSKIHHEIHSILRILLLHQVLKTHRTCSVLHFPQPVREPRQSVIPTERLCSPFASLQVKMS